MDIIKLFSEFRVGRLREGQHEFSSLNGWMTPDRARHCFNSSNSNSLAKVQIKTHVAA